MTEEKSLPLKHWFSDDELNDMRDNIANLVQEQTKVELEKKEVTKDFADDLKSIKQRIKTVAMHLHDKYTEHDVMCTIEYHSPTKNVKTITRSDTNEQWMDDMTAADYNLFNQGFKSQEEE